MKKLRLLDLISLFFVTVLVLAATLPAVDRARETEARALCAEHLRRIGDSMAFYANNETRLQMTFPRCRFDPEKADRPQAFTGWNQPESFGPHGPGPNDVTASLYLLVKTMDLDPQALVCPSSARKAMTFADHKPVPTDAIASAPKAISNFPGVEYLSYSIHNMYPANQFKSGFTWNPTLIENFALVADLNPGGNAVSTVTPASSAALMARANSPNHDGAGQNVLSSDLHVEWTTNPFCGPALPNGQRDNIYCRRAGAKGDPVMGPAIDKYDCVLLPTAVYKAGR